MKKLKLGNKMKVIDIDKPCEHCQGAKVSTRARYRNDVGLTLCMSCYDDELCRVEQEGDGVSSNDYDNQQSGESEVSG